MSLYFQLTNYNIVFFRQQLEQHQLNVVQMKICDPNGDYVKGVILTVRGSKINQCVDQSGRVYDFCSRYFCPWFGITEDPVTGAAHCALGPYWSNKLKKTDLYGKVEIKNFIVIAENFL